jgi:hypothetical protein
MIQTTQIEYAKALKGIWMKHDWKSASNNSMRCKETGLFTKYHD